MLSRSTTHIRHSGWRGGEGGYSSDETTKKITSSITFYNNHRYQLQKESHV